MTLEGQRIVVLGGSSGIGLATAQAAAREGARVVIASSRKDRIEAALVTLPTGSEGHVLDLPTATRPERYSRGSAVFIIWSSQPAKHCNSAAWQQRTLTRRAASTRCA